MHRWKCVLNSQTWRTASVLKLRAAECPPDPHNASCWAQIQNITPHHVTLQENRPCVLLLVREKEEEEKKKCRPFLYIAQLTEINEAFRARVMTQSSVVAPSYVTVIWDLSRRAERASAVLCAGDTIPCFWFILDRRRLRCYLHWQFLRKRPTDTGGSYLRNCPGK